MTLEHITITCCALHCQQGFKGIQSYPDFQCSYSPLFSGTGWMCCWSAGRAHCGSPPGCGRRTRSSSVLTGAGVGSWQLRWSAWSPRQGCRSGLREGSEGNPAETNKEILNFCPRKGGQLRKKESKGCSIRSEEQANKAQIAVRYEKERSNEINHLFVDMSQKKKRSVGYISDFTPDLQHTQPKELQCDALFTCVTGLCNTPTGLAPDTNAARQHF